MGFVKGAEVYTAKGEKVGTINRIVIDAKTRDVTDLVVERGALFKDEKVVPIGLVDLENEGRIVLRETNQNIEDFLNYETTHYVRVDQPGAVSDDVETAYWYPPVNVQMQLPHAGVYPAARPDQVVHEEAAIPEGRIVISEGAQVMSADDKHIGNVEQVIMDVESTTVTHFVVGKGFLLKEHKLVPAFWVRNAEDDKIHLSVEYNLFDRLPDYNTG